jgi:group II intron reverse transcriptase/maturase
VIDADLSDYFGSIPHAELMECVAARVSDSRVLALVKAWMVAPVEEKDARGNMQRTTRNKDEGRGTPQGAPLSPLLANLYMRKFILAWKQEGAYFKAKIINYADDFVILCSYRAERALQVMTDLLARMKLTVNAAKTRVCKLPDESFNFLGYTFGNYWSWRKQRMQLSRRPSPQSLKRVKAKLTALTSRRQTQLDEKTMVQRLNRQLVGWANYFSQGAVVQAFRSVDRHIEQRLRLWLGAKHKQSGLRHDLYPHSYLYERLGLISLTQRQLATVREQHGCGD